VNFHADMPAHNSDLSTSLYSVHDSMGSQRRHHVLIQLACTLKERYRYTGDALDLESASKHGAEALELCHAESIICPTVWVVYADILENNFEATTNSGELHKADILCREAIPLCSPDHPLSATIHHTLSWILIQKTSQSEDEATIAEAVHLQRVGLNRLHETKSHYKHRHLHRLAHALLVRNHQTRSSQDRNEALSMISEAIRLCPSMHVDRWMLHLSIMQHLLMMYPCSGDLRVLNRAIEFGRQCRAMGNFPNPTRRAKFLCLMADILRIRFQVARKYDEDLEESIQLYRKALRIYLPGNVNYGMTVHGLALVLVMHFRLDGDMDHLEEASELHHHASDILPKSHPLWPDNASGSAECLALRYMEIGDISDINRAINLDREAMDVQRPSAFNYVCRALGMASHLCLRFEVLHRDVDLVEAINVADTLLKSLSDSDTSRPAAAHVLAKARLLRARDNHDVGEMDLTIEQLLSIKGKLPQFMLSSEILRTLAACYMVKFRQTSAIEHAFHARHTMNEVLESFPPEHYEGFQCLIDAAGLYIEHGTPFHDIDIALNYFSDAMRSSHIDVRLMLRSAKRFFDEIKIEKHSIFTTTSSTSLKLLDIIASAVMLLPRIAFFSIHPHSRLQSLQMGQSLAMIGASHALNLHLPERAVEILEQGRAIFWTHTLRLRLPFDEIPTYLRDRLVALARRLDKVAIASDSFTDRQHLEREIAQRRKDSAEFNLLIDQIRSLPGQECFMLPDKYSILREVAENGPVVVLVCSTLACYAVILRLSGKPSRIPLKSITEKWLEESALLWSSAVVEARLAVRDERKLVKSKKNSHYIQAEQILRFLWMNVAFPVFKALRIEVCAGIPPPRMPVFMYMTYSLRMVVIVLAFGGVRLDISHICRFTLQVLTASGVQITSYRPILPQSATYLARKRCTRR
jgi:tetratricopeptide (TPR) repeat protein